jgi:hypothetical protein
VKYEEAQVRLLCRFSNKAFATGRRNESMGDLDRDPEGELESRL